MDSRVWAEVSALLGDPDRLEVMARDWVGSRAEQADSHREELERVTAQIAKLETSLTTTVVEYARQGLPVAAVKAATDAIQTDLVKLRRRRDELTVHAPAIFDATHSLAAVAGSRLATMTPDEQIEVLALLDVRVSVLDNSRSPRIRLEGTLPYAADGSASLIVPWSAAPGIPFELVA